MSPSVNDVDDYSSTQNLGIMLSNLLSWEAVSAKT